MNIVKTPYFRLYIFSGNRVNQREMYGLAINRHFYGMMINHDEQATMWGIYRIKARGLKI